MLKKYVHRVLLMLIPVLFLTGCFEELKDGYQFGDVSKITIRKMNYLELARREYCNTDNETSLRAMALHYIQINFKNLPIDELCTNPTEADIKELASKLPVAYAGFYEHIRDGPN